MRESLGIRTGVPSAAAVCRASMAAGTTDLPAADIPGAVPGMLQARVVAREERQKHPARAAVVKEVGHEVLRKADTPGALHGLRVRVRPQFRCVSLLLLAAQRAVEPVDRQHVREEGGGMSTMSRCDLETIERSTRIVNVLWDQARGEAVIVVDGLPMPFVIEGTSDNSPVVIANDFLAWHEYMCEGMNTHSMWLNREMDWLEEWRQFRAIRGY